MKYIGCALAKAQKLKPRKFLSGGLLSDSAKFFTKENLMIYGITSFKAKLRVLNSLTWDCIEVECCIVGIVGVLYYKSK